MSRKDYRVYVKVKNANLLRAIESAGYKTIGSFCRANHMSPSLVGSLASLKIKPRNSSGDWKDIVEKISTVLNVMPSDLFSEEQMTPVTKNTGHIDVSLEEVSTMLTQTNNNPLTLLEEQDDKITVDAALIHSRLTTNEKEVLRMRFGIDCEESTLKVVAQKLKISAQRVRQIEAKALRKIRKNRAVIPHLREVYNTMDIKQWGQTQ